MKRGRVYNRIFNQEEWNKVNPLNKEIMEDYKMELKQKQKSEGTIEQYWNDWKIICLYIYRKLDKSLKRHTLLEFNISKALVKLL